MGKWTFFGYYDLRVKASTVVEAETFNEAECEAHDRFDTMEKLESETTDNADVVTSRIERHEEIEPEN